MKPLEKEFKRINRIYFNNLLPVVPIIERDRKVKVIQGYLTFGDDKRTKPEIIIYKCWGKDIQILIHEMLHLEQWVEKLPIRHGKQFEERENLIYANIRDSITTQSKTKSCPDNKDK